LGRRKKERKRGEGRERRGSAKGAKKIDT